MQTNNTFHSGYTNTQDYIEDNSNNISSDQYVPAAYEAEDGDVLKLISKKKELHRVEIRKKQTSEKIKQHRLQISEQHEIQKMKDYLEQDKLNAADLNINQSIDGFLQAHQKGDQQLIEFEVKCIRLCVSAEEKLKELKYSNAMLYDKGVLPLLFQYLQPQYDSEFDLQRDALWIVTHFIGDVNLRNIFYVMENVPSSTFFRLVYSTNYSIQHNALLSIFNIINENELGAQFMIKNGVVAFLAELLCEYVPQHSNILQQTLLIVRDLFQWANKENTFVELENLMPLIEGLFPIFSTAENEEGTIDTVFEALEAITERDDSDMEQFYGTCNGLILKTIDYIRRNEKKSDLVLLPPMLILNNLSNGFDEISEGLIQFGLLDILSSLIKHRKVKVQRLALSTLSNVSASGGVVVSYLMQHKVIIMDVLNAIQIGDFIVKSEAIVAFCHMLMTVRRKEIEEFVLDYQAFEVLVEQLNKYVDVSLNDKIVRAMIAALEVGEDLKRKRNYFYNPFARRFNKIGGRAKAELLVESKNEELRSNAEKLLVISYKVDEADEEFEEDNKNPEELEQEDDDEEEYDQDVEDNDEADQEQGGKKSS